jgi:outer membrane biosynthesis protein TonB
MPSPARVLPFLARIAGSMGACAAVAAALSAQDAQPRQLSAAETGCDSSSRAPTDSAFQADSVDRMARAPYVRVNTLPYRMRDVRTGRTMLRFIVDSSGRVERCSITLVEESSPDWTAAVLPELRRARYEPARKDGRQVRQVVYQVFTYHSDGRSDVAQ